MLDRETRQSSHKTLVDHLRWRRHHHHHVRSPRHPRAMGRAHEDPTTSSEPGRCQGGRSGQGTSKPIWTHHRRHHHQPLSPSVGAWPPPSAAPLTGAARAGISTIDQSQAAPAAPPGLCSMTPVAMAVGGGARGWARGGWRRRLVMSTHASILLDSVGPPSAEVCRTTASFP
jgi:hypothetical protein